MDLHPVAPPTSLDQLKHQTSFNHSNSPQTFQLSPILLVATLNGQLHALDRQTGTWNWTLHHPNQHSTSFQNPAGLVHSPRLSSHEPQPDEDHELFAIEPWKDGDLYVFIKSPSQPSRLEKLPLSVSQLVNLSPFTFPGDSSKMFIGKKETHLIAIDLKTGVIINSLHSPPKHGSYKGKERSNAHDQCHPEHFFYSPPTQTKFQTKSCPTDPPTSTPIPTPTDRHHSSIDQRPRDLLYIGRTDYQVSIYSKPNTLIQTLRYSTYAPSNLPHSLQTMWSRTPDELYLEPTHDGNLICFQTNPQSPSTPTSSSEHPKIKWQNSFDHPVTSIFDIVFPNACQTSPTPDPTNEESQDPGPSNIPHQPNTPNSNSPQQPILFVQPKFLLPKSDRSHIFSTNDQFDHFKYLHSQTTFSPSSQSMPPIDQKQAFIGKYQESFYVMSQHNYPLVTFAPPAFQTLGTEPQIGTHILLNSQALSGFVDFPYTNRLLNPATTHNAHLPLALDPAPHPLTLPTPEQLDKTKTTSSSRSNPSNAPLTLSTSKVSPNSEKLPTKKAIAPVELHQRPAQISSLLVKAFKQQLMLNGPESSPRNQRYDDRFDLNPLLTFLLVLVVISWWASRKLESPSTTRWEHLHRLVHQALGNVSKTEQISNMKKISEVKDSPCGPTTMPIEESERGANPDALNKLRDGVQDPESLLPNSKQKPKRRRGKRPGQKAAAAAAKAQAELTNPQDSADLLPDSVSLLKPPSSEDNKTPQKPKPNAKHVKLTTVAETKSFVPASLSPTPNNETTANNIITPVATLSIFNDQGFLVDQPINSDMEPSTRNSNGLEPHRVGSLIVTNETIGYGSHGTVVLKGTFQGRQVAVKRLLKDFVTLASHEVSLLQESDDHPNVVRYFVKESLNNFLYIALELCNASLHDFIERKQFKEFEELEQIFNPKKALKQITSGLRYLHKLKIVHRDVKPQNILISLTRSLLPSSSSSRTTSKTGAETKRFRMLISDFGLCKKLELDESSFAQTANHAAGSFGYRAPEILKGQVNLSEQRDSMASSSLTNSTVQNAAGMNSDSNASSSASNLDSNQRHRLTRSIDIFSLGCIYYYVLTKGDHPFGSRYEREINILKDEVWLDQLDGLDEETFEAQQLIRWMIKSDPKERPTAEEVLQNPYFWEASKRLNFLCDCSDRFEAMDRDPPEPTLLKLENLNSFSQYLSTKPNHHRSALLSPYSQKHFDWCKVIDRGLVDNLGKYRKYDSGSIRDLLRVMRNKKHHYQDLPEGIKEKLGEIPEGFLNYFSKKFPSLLVHVYHIVVFQSDLKSEKIFHNYFDIVDDI